MTQKHTLLILIIIVSVVLGSVVSGCLGDKDDTMPQQLSTMTQPEPLNKSDQFIQDLDIRVVPLNELEKSNPQICSQLITFGINRVAYVKSENVDGWKFDFASNTGSRRFTDIIIEDPRTSIGLYGQVSGHVILLGSIPAYKFTNEEMWYYIMNIGNAVIVMGGTDQSLAYEDCKSMAEYTSDKLGNPKSNLNLENIGDQIYPKGSDIESSDIEENAVYKAFGIKIPVAFAGSVS